MLALRGEANFHALFRQGRRSYAPWAALYARLRTCQEPGPDGPRLGVSTGGKFPNSVQRNRARRLVRETSRVMLGTMVAPWDLLFVVRPGILGTSFRERCQTIEELLRQAGLPVEGLAVGAGRPQVVGGGKGLGRV